MLLWDEADLEVRLSRALDIAEKVIRHFGADGYLDAQSANRSFHAEKPVAETAMLLWAASGAGHRLKVREQINHVAELLAPYARSERVLLDIALHPGLAFKFAVPHILLARLGLPDPTFDRLLEACAGAQVRNGVDRAPTAALERQWIRAALNGEGQADQGVDLSHTVLGWPLDLFGGLRADYYSFTHLLMYETDFGFRSAALPRSQQVVLLETGALLARHLDAEDYDLAAETILAWPFLNAAWSPSAAFGFRVLTHLEDTVGILPCSLMDGERLAQLEGAERGIYALATSYHTAFVMGIACAACLRPGRLPPGKIAGAPHDEATLYHLQDLASADQGHWHELFFELDVEERSALVPFLLDIAFIQANRRRDYSGMHTLIQFALGKGLASTPICGQAAELLERIAAAAKQHANGACARSA